LELEAFGLNAQRSRLANRMLRHCGRDAHTPLRAFVPSCLLPRYNPALVQTMNITLNGESRPLDGAPTISDLLAECGLTPQRVAVEVNEQLVRRVQFDQTRLHDGDRIEIVTLVGGG
jgi:sulfur carrier protein